MSTEHEHAYREHCESWCEEHGVSHGHCPLECEHPQPFLHPEHGFICGRCWFVCERTVSVMVPCEC